MVINDESLDFIAMLDKGKKFREENQVKSYEKIFDETKSVLRETGLLEETGSKSTIKGEETVKKLSLLNILSPKIASIFPRTNNKGEQLSQLSPSLLSFYEEKDEATSIPSILQVAGMRKGGNSDSKL
ncbi:unnamed protein product [Enterobius vermicularis]|uniref:Ovule protein n=1 Tax=Enterobius vermicularis TaxID=51028 RepID=A0A0N4V743_ENTVE|nr:unnamed protein product [Enterobius vermicularis]